jgi:hypothetical protein
MSPIGTVGSTDLDEYAVDTRENQAEVALDSGSGLKLTADVWFTCAFPPFLRADFSVFDGSSCIFHTTR